jgi:hypothetical protein
MSSRASFLSIFFITYLVLANLFSKKLHPSCMHYSRDHEHEIVAHTAAQKRDRANSSMLPETLYVIYGLESSGTTFMASTVSMALGIERRLRPDTVESNDKKIHIQHISLPLGGVGKDNWGFSETPGIVPVYYPTGCRVPPFKTDPPGYANVTAACRTIMGEKVMTSPHRYFVNITSHVQWYREWGVDVHPIMVVRDPSFHFYGVTNGHCRNESAAYAQYEMGRDILVHSMQAVKPTIVSYEMLMTIQGEYLIKIYNQTNIQSSYIPKFKNGNLKHLSNETRPYIKEQLQKEDFGHVLQDRSKLTNYRMTTAGGFNKQNRQRQKGSTRRAPPKGTGGQAKNVQRKKPSQQQSFLGRNPLGLENSESMQLLLQQIQNQQATDSEQNDGSDNTAAAENVAALQEKLQKMQK